MEFLFLIAIVLFLTFVVILICSIIGARRFHISLARLGTSKTGKNDSDTIVSVSDKFVNDIDINTLKENGKHHLIFFSDLHAEYCFIPVERLCKEIDDISSKIRIDAVIFGGDLCSGPETSAKGIEYLSKLSDHLKTKGIPFLGTNGNHDVGISDEDMEKCGFIDLRKAPYDMGEYVISGVNDSGRQLRIWDHNPISDVNFSKRHIVVAHNPDWLLPACEYNEMQNIDHMLSGHIHGGQIRMPFNFENIAIRQDALPKRKIIKGVYDGAGMTFFISRGLGCVRLPLRFLADPEITVIELE